MKTLRFLILPIVLSILGGSGLLWAQGAPSGIPQTLRVRTIGINAAPNATSGIIQTAANYDSSTTSQLNLINTTAGCTSDLCVPFNATNSTDADFRVAVTDVGAATKFAQIGPTVNIPLKFVSRATSQELLKMASATGSAAASTCVVSANVTACNRTGTGTYNIDLTAANFTVAPSCAVTSGLLTANCAHGTTTTTSSGAFSCVTTLTGAAVDAVHSVVCIGQ